MLKLLPILALVAYGFIAWQFSSWRLKRELSSRSRPLDDPALEAAVKRLGRALELPALRAHVYEIPAFNGLAAPDGRVFVTQGVIDQYRLGKVEANEVASIIAHELGHVALGHSKRRMIDWSGQNALRWVLAAVIGRFVPFIGPWIANMAASLLSAGLSRRDEFEADAFAAALMRKANLDPAAQASLLQKLDRMTPKGGGAFAWLMSHPPAEKRVKAIEALHRKWDSGDAAPDPALRG
ncbi:MAG: M48 family metalloprotease [Pseudomonadota bacterium]